MSKVQSVNISYLELHRVEGPLYDVPYAAE
jgi:hypothetical protein